jgi:uncharacterized secreted protein with C-terminal beta-propeller domain
MGWSFNTHGTNDKYIQFLSENLKERGRLEDLGIDDRIY